MLTGIIESAQIGFMQGILILIGILWVGGYLRRVIYVPVVIKEKESEKKSEKDIIVQDEEKMIYRTKERPDESYTDFEEIK